MYTYSDIFHDKKKILFVTAHPDDVDVFFGGTISLLNNDRKDTFVLLVTNGGRGSKEVTIMEEELAKQRLEEEKTALSILGFNPHNLLCLNYLDGEVENTMRLIGEITKYIREISPDIVCTHDPHGYYFHSRQKGRSYINHRDHRNAGLSVLDAVYPFSRDASFFPEQLENGKKPVAIFNVMVTPDSGCNTSIDITNVIGKKRYALLTHKSQFDKDITEIIIHENKKADKYFERFNYLKLAW